MNKVKGTCCMASYCKFSDDNKHCTAAYDVIMENCPYLNAIGEIAKLSMELTGKGVMENKDLCLEK